LNSNNCTIFEQDNEILTNTKNRGGGLNNKDNIKVCKVYGGMLVCGMHAVCDMVVRIKNELKS